MKTLLIVFLILLATGRAQAQWLSLQELLTFAEKDTEGHFLEDFSHASKAEKRLRELGFARVRWRENDPDIDRNLASYKLYSRTANAYLIFHADAHGRLLEELVYRVRSPACVVQLRKQLLAAGFVDHKSGVVPDEDDPNTIARFSPYDMSCTNPEYSITITGEVDAQGKDLHRYSVAIGRDAAMQQMYDEINAMHEETEPDRPAKPLKKPH